MKRYLFLLLSFFVFINHGISQLIQSTFNNSIDGWTCEGDVDLNPILITSNGNPGGYISNTDYNTGDVWYWIAPTKYLGNQSSKYGKSLQYDIKQSLNDTYTGDDIVIEGSGLRIIYRADYQPTTDWTTFIVSLTESSGWYLDATGNPPPTKAQMQSVLSNITKLKIRAEYSNRKDIDGLDNVIFGETRYYSGSGNACLFNGKNSYISLGNNTLLKPTNQLSVQCWALFKDLVDDYRLVSNTNSGGYSIYYNISDNKIHFDIRIGNNYVTVIGQKPLVNSWHHYTLTYDGHFLKGYIDGVLQQSVDAGASQITYSGSNSTLIGAEAGSADIPASGFPYLNGYVDEVSFWNKSLTQTQIRNWMCRKIKPAHPAYSSLLAYYKFDEEKSDVKLYDQKLAVQGILRNSAIFQLSGASIGDTSANVYNNNSISISHPDGDSLYVEISAGKPAGIQAYRVDQAPSITKGIKGLGPNNRYFGVFCVNDTSTTYNVVYNYNGNPFVTTSAEPSLKLYKRNNNADTVWLRLNAVLNKNLNTLSTSDQKTEYIIGAADTALHKKSNVSIANISVSEGNSGSKLAKFVFQLDAPMNGTSFINFKTKDSTATMANNDYQLTSGTVKWEPGSVKDTVQVRVYGDVNIEPDEFFKLLISKPVNIQYVDSISTCKIKNDDVASSNNESSLINDSKLIIPTLLSRKEVWRISNNNHVKISIVLFDELGKTVFEEKNYRNNVVLNSLKPGVYYYRILSFDELSNKKYTGKILLTE